MTPKFRQQLELALTPTTPAPQVQASLAALRAMVQENGIEVYLRPELKAHTKIVYQDRIVYRDGAKDLSHEARITLTIPADYHHNMIEHVFHRALELETEVDVLKCSTNTGKTQGSTVLQLRVKGSDSAVKKYDAELGDYMHKINLKTGTHSGKNSANLKTRRVHQMGWFWRWFLS